MSVDLRGWRCAQKYNPHEKVHEREGKISQVKNNRVIVEVRWEEGNMCSFCSPRKSCLATAQIKIAEYYLQGLFMGKSNSYWQQNRKVSSQQVGKHWVFCVRALSSHSLAIPNPAQRWAWLLESSTSQSPLKGPAERSCQSVHLRPPLWSRLDV